MTATQCTYINRTEPAQKTFVLLEITHKKEVPDLIDKVAGRAYTIDGVSDVTAKILSPEEVRKME